MYQVGSKQKNSKPVGTEKTVPKATTIKKTRTSRSQAPALGQVVMNFELESNVPVEPSQGPSVLTVSALNSLLKETIEENFSLIWLKGEISNFKAHSNGHFYFSLKDSNSQISAVMFRGHNSKMKFQPVDGMEVVVRGRLSLYEPRGSYQIVCEIMDPIGAGALQKAFEQLKEKLRLEGLFDVTKKRKLPRLPMHVAIVTSPTGAAVRDILQILKRRAPFLPVTIVPTVVQGSAAAKDICTALDAANRLSVDVIILARGGGSIEDMWCFNDEVLARRIAASPIPTISAVGHEIDFTICDFVADFRAPTPSSAAEVVCSSLAELQGLVITQSQLLSRSMQKVLLHKQQVFRLLQRGLVDPKKKLTDLLLRNDELKDRLVRANQMLLERLRARHKLATQKLIDPSETIAHKRQLVALRLEKLMQQIQYKLQSLSQNLRAKANLLNSVSPLAVVARGYAIVTDEKSQHVIRSTAQVELQQPLVVQVADGKILVNVTDKQPMSTNATRKDS